MTAGDKIAKRTRGAPEHLAIIPDGNRRWSHENRLSLLHSYNLGIRKFIDVSIWAKELGVKTISVWALSTENIANRSGSELSTLYRLYGKAAKDPYILNLLKKNDARVRIIGDTKLLPPKLRVALRGLERKTQTHKSFSINILLGYGGREDILHAVKKMVRKHVKRFDYETIKKNLMTALLPDADMIIRTSGEMRLSGFLPWQGGYSELYFYPKYWPNFGKADLTKAIKSFSDRDRRFGK